MTKPVYTRTAETRLAAAERDIRFLERRASCCLSSPSGGTFEGVVLETSDLLAYWRLGEPGSPWADTSGVAPPVPMVEQGTGTALTPDIAGALEHDDDGAVELNYDGTASGGGRYLHASNAKPFDLVDPEGMTAAVWAKVKASALTRTGIIFGTCSLIAYGPDYHGGWGIHVAYPSRVVSFHYGRDDYLQTPAGLIADQWYFIAATQDDDNLKLYMNGTLVDETAWGGWQDATNSGVSIGAGYDGTMRWHYGSVDEAALWTRALTAEEIATLYASGVEVGGGEGDYVLVSDGAGGSSWGKVETEAIAAAAVTPAKLEAGADREVLRSSGGAVAWALPTIRVNY
jgi:concanavalin A-like lectin/glucanase superfamily protein